MPIPQILQQLSANSLPGNLPQIKNMMQMVRSAGNPQALLAQMAQNNPQMRQAMELVGQYGGDPQKAFYALAQQRGVNPDEILNMLR